MVQLTVSIEMLFDSCQLNNQWLTMALSWYSGSVGCTAES